MVNRRDFFRGVGSIAVAQLFSGCADQQSDLKVLLLQNSIPAQLVKQFKSDFSQQKINFKPEAQLEEIFKLLKLWQQKPDKKMQANNLLTFFEQKSPRKSDLVTVGDYWLTEAIALKLIQPLKVETLSGWNNLPKNWQDLVRRNEQGNADPKGSIWGAPYRWGSTIIAYRQDKFEALGWSPTDWSDLWREELRGRISILDQPREVIGLTLKKLGYSYNTNDLTKVPNLKSELLALHKNVKFYSSSKYLEPLILGDTWIAVGWSTDILPILPNYPKIKTIMPKSGTALWTDIWVKPKQEQDKDNSDLYLKWIDFCWQPEAAHQISLYTDGLSPVILTQKKEAILPDILKSSLLPASNTTLEESEFIDNLSPEVTEKYLALWKEVRSLRY